MLERVKETFFRARDCGSTADTKAELRVEALANPGEFQSLGLRL